MLDGEIADFAYIGTKRPWQAEGNSVFGADGTAVCGVLSGNGDDATLIVEAVNVHSRLKLERDYAVKRYRTLRWEFEELVNKYAKAKEENGRLRDTLAELSGDDGSVTQFDHG